MPRLDPNSVRELRRMQMTLKGLTRTNVNTAEVDNPDQPEPSSHVLIDFAKITEAGADSTHWKWKISQRDHTTGKFTEGLQGSDDWGECVIADAGPGYVGLTGLLYWQQNDDDTASIVMVPVATAFAFPVSVEMTSGSAGDATTAATFEYTVKDINTGDVLTLNSDGDPATNMIPTWQRPIGKTLEASFGLARRNATGDLDLFMVDEVPDKGQCAT